MILFLLQAWINSASLMTFPVQKLIKISRHIIPKWGIRARVGHTTHTPSANRNIFLDCDLLCHYSYTMKNTTLAEENQVFMQQLAQSMRLERRYWTSGDSRSLGAIFRVPEESARGTIRTFAPTDIKPFKTETLRCFSTLLKHQIISKALYVDRT